jgi:hypothetical protein
LRAARLAAGLGLALPSGACSGPPGAGRQLGDDLGGFQVRASEAANGCGAGALGSRPSFDFEIDLAREQGELFWGRQGSTRLDAALRFELLDGIRVELRPARGSQPGCSIGRADRIAGTLSQDESGQVLGFTGRLEHTFEVVPGELCSLDDRLEAGLVQLPCTLAYDLTGERWREPE